MLISLKLSRTFLLTNRYFKCPVAFCSTAHDERDSSLESKKINNETEIKQKKVVRKRSTRSQKVIGYYANEPQLNDFLHLIPSKYFSIKNKGSTIQHLYLADQDVAKDIAWHILPFLLKNEKPQVVAETNAGLGLITAELLQSQIKIMRIYEACPEFKNMLKVLHARYFDRIELFNKDIYNLHILAFQDRYDNEHRVQEVLEGVPNRDWKDDPVMTIIGPMPNLNFIGYLLKSLCLQEAVTSLGRIQIFALMRPDDYLKLAAVPGMSLRIYQLKTILFQLLCEYKILKKYPRKSFLPWERIPNRKSENTTTTTDADHIYLVQINFKKNLPVEPQYLLHLLFYLKEGFRRGRTLVIPTLENWIPGIGIDVITAKSRYKKKCYPSLNIYTEFGELTPEESLHVFLEMIKHPEYRNSCFTDLIQTHLVRSETIDSDLVSNTTDESVKKV